MIQDLTLNTVDFQEEIIKLQDQHYLSR